MTTFLWILAALILMFGTGMLIAVVPDALARRRERRRVCPHGVRGGVLRRNCLDCNRDRLTACRQKRKLIADQERQGKLRDVSKQLRDHEAARLARYLVPSLDELRGLTPQRFEDEMARMFERLDYRVEQTPYVNDQGRDAIMYNKVGDKHLMECKRYRAGGTSGRPDIQKFHSAIMVANASKGLFITTGKFTPGAVEYVRARALPIELVDGERLLRYMLDSKKGDRHDDRYRSVCLECGSLVEHSLRRPVAQQCGNGHVVLPPLTVEDLFVGRGPPDCVNCGTPMRVVTGRHGKFWGCSRYPACRSVRSFAQR